VAASAAAVQTPGCKSNTQNFNANLRDLEGQATEDSDARAKDRHMHCSNGGGSSGALGRGGVAVVVEQLGVEVAGVTKLLSLDLSKLPEPKDLRGTISGQKAAWGGGGGDREVARREKARGVGGEGSEAARLAKTHTVAKTKTRTTMSVPNLHPAVSHPAVVPAAKNQQVKGRGGAGSDAGVLAGLKRPKFAVPRADGGGVAMLVPEGSAGHRGVDGSGGVHREVGEENGVGVGAKVEILVPHHTPLRGAVRVDKRRVGVGAKGAGAGKVHKAGAAGMTHMMFLCDDAAQDAHNLWALNALRDSSEWEEALDAELALGDAAQPKDEYGLLSQHTHTHKHTYKHHPHAPDRSHAPLVPLATPLTPGNLGGILPENFEGASHSARSHQGDVAGEARRGRGAERGGSSYVEAGGKSESRAEETVADASGVGQSGSGEGTENRASGEGIGSREGGEAIGGMAASRAVEQGKRDMPVDSVRAHNPSQNQGVGGRGELARVSITSASPSRVKSGGGRGGTGSSVTRVTSAAWGEIEEMMQVRYSQKSVRYSLYYRILPGSLLVRRSRCCCGKT